MNALRRVKITNTMPDGSIDVWFATAAPTNKSVGAQIRQLNKIAKDRRIPATYEPATEAQYRAYRDSIKVAA